MSMTKEKILRTIELMDDDNAELVLDWINSNFVLTYKQRTWDDIEEEEADDIDLEMMQDIESNPDCKEFIFKDDLIAKRISRI